MLEALLGLGLGLLLAGAAAWWVLRNRRRQPGDVTTGAVEVSGLVPPASAGEASPEKVADLARELDAPLLWTGARASCTWPPSGPFTPGARARGRPSEQVVPTRHTISCQLGVALSHRKPA